MKIRVKHTKYCNVNSESMRFLEKNIIKLHPILDTYIFTQFIHTTGMERSVISIKHDNLIIHRKNYGA